MNFEGVFWYLKLRFLKIFACGSKNGGTKYFMGGDKDEGGQKNYGGGLFKKKNRMGGNPPAPPPFFAPRKKPCKAIGGVKGQNFMLSLYERAFQYEVNAFYGMLKFDS